MDHRRFGAKIAADYDRGAPQYRHDDEIEARSENHQRLGGNLRRICRSFSHPIRVLELGCGTGRYFHWLENTDLLVGTDISAEMLKQAAYDFVVSDVDMPRMNGFDLVAAMRRDPALQAVPALLVTREPSKDQVVRASRVGANGYVVRPLTRAVLEDRIRSVLGLPPLTLPRRPSLGGLSPGAMR